MSTRDEYVAKMKHQLDEWNAEIDSLEAKVRQAKEDAKRLFIVTEKFFTVVSPPARPL